MYSVSNERVVEQIRRFDGLAKRIMRWRAFLTAILGAYALTFERSIEVARRMTNVQDYLFLLTYCIAVVLILLAFRWLFLSAAYYDTEGLVLNEDFNQRFEEDRYINVLVALARANAQIYKRHRKLSAATFVAAERGYFAIKAIVAMTPAIVLLYVLSVLTS